MDLNPEAHIGRFRRRETRLMRSMCTISRRDPDADPVWDDTKGEYTYPPLEVYAGKCRLAYPSRAAGDVEAGGSAYSISDYIVTLPIDTDVRIDDTITITASDDPVAVGLVLVVETVPKSDWQVVRKAACREYTQETT